ncbi:hypothetical protein HZU77_002940 [Neisseriaceae bacterium TC5R-5]|nr:hypothetical protein [Neisseriaceae bacterium TC5R-5]
MRKSCLAIAVALSLSSCMAVAGTVSFQGELTSNSCVMTVNGAADAVVLLPTVLTSALATAGQVADKTSFEVSLSYCSTATPQIKLLANNINATSGSFGGNANVKLQLLTTLNQVVKFTSAGAVLVPSKLVNNAETSPLFIQYYTETTSTKTPGAITGSLQYAVAYP